MTGRRDYRLRFQHFSTGSTMASLRFSGCLTGRFHSCIAHRRMTGRRDYRLSFQHFSAGRAVASFGFSCCLTGSFHSGVGNCGVAFCRDRFLRFQHFSAGRAVASFRLFGGLAGCFYGCVCYFGVTRCRLLQQRRHRPCPGSLQSSRPGLPPGSSGLPFLKQYGDRLLHHEHLFYERQNKKDPLYPARRTPGNPGGDCGECGAGVVYAVTTLTFFPLKAIFDAVFPGSRF